MNTTTFEREIGIAAQGILPVGIDEAGRGPLAGPVVAAAVVFKNRQYEIPEARVKEFSLIQDSKKLSPKQRERANELVHEFFFVGVGIIGPETIDRVNILQATFLAMRAAVSDLSKQLPTECRGMPLHLLLDGNQELPNISHSQEAIVEGDDLVKSIAAASIIAKVTRDRRIIEADREFPGYDFSTHKGYGTKVHMDALRRLGPSPIHRMSFEPVRMSLPENVNRKLSALGRGRLRFLAKKPKDW